MKRAITHVLWSIGDAIAENGLMFIWGLIIVGFGTVAILLDR